jgi:hypothetical protein
MTTEWFATTDDTARLVPPLDVAAPLALALMVEEVDGHRFAVATRGARLMRQRMLTPVRPDLLGQSTEYTVGDRAIEIGWRQSHPMFAHGEYAKRPTAYIKTKTTGRGVEKGQRYITPKSLRQLARNLNAWASVVERHQAAWDAAEKSA